MDLENQHNMKNKWFMRENGNLIKDKGLVDKFGLIKVHFKDSG